MQYIAIENFKSYESQVINNLNPQINIIIGKNGEGKSNFFKAISFALTNKVSLNKSEFSSHRHTGINAPRPGLIKVQLYVKSKLNQQKYDQNIQHLQRIWHNDTNEEFKANDKTFTAHQYETYVESLGFAYSNPYNIIQQGKITQITLMDQFQIYKLLEEATGLKKYEKRLTEALDYMKKNEDNKNEIKTILHDIQTRLNSYQEKREQYQYYSFQQKAGKVKSRLQFQNLINKFNSDLKDLKQRESRSFDKLTKLKLSIRDKEAQLGQINDKVSVNQKQMQSFVSSTNDDENLMLAGNISQQHKQYASRLKKISNNKQKLHKQLQKISGQVQKIKQEMKPYKQKYQYLTSQLQAVKSSKLGQSKAKEQLKNQIKKYEQNVKEIDNELKKVNKMKSEFKIDSGQSLNNQINSKKQRLTVVLNDLRTNKIKYFEASRQKNQFDSEIDVVKQHIEVNYSKMRKLLPYMDFNLLNELKKQKIQGVYGYLIQFLSIETDFLFAYELAGLNKLCTLLVQNEQVCNTVININKKMKGRQINILPLSFVKKSPHMKKALPEVDDCFSLLNQTWIKIKPHSFGEQFTKIVEKIVGNAFGSHLLVKDYDIGLRVSKQYHVNCITADKEIVYSQGYLCKVGKDANLYDRLQFYMKYQEKNQQSEHISSKLNEVNKQIMVLQNVELDLMKKKVQLQTEIRNTELKLELINEQKRSLSKLQDQSKKIQQKKLKYSQQINRKKQILNNFDKKGQININMNEYKETQQLFKAKLKLYNQKSEQECTLENKLKQTVKEEQSINQQLKTLNNQLSFQKQFNHRFVDNKEYQNQLQEMNRQLLKQKQALEAEIIKMNTHYAQIQNQNYTLLGQMGIIQEEIGYYSSKIQEIGSLDITMQEIEEKSNSFSLSFTRLEEKRKMRIYSAGERMIFGKIDSYIQRHKEAIKKLKELQQYERDINEMIHSYERQKQRSITNIFSNFQRNFDSIFKAITLNGKTDLRLKKTNDRSRGLNKTKNSIAIMISFGGQATTSWNEFSGGQKTVIAVCLLIALQKCQPAPFYILDEIDSALDQVYLQRIVRLIQAESERSQYFITSFKHEMLQIRQDKCNYYLVSNRDRVSHIQRITHDQAKQKINELMSW